MDLHTPARHIGTELERAPSGALSVSELAASYHHPNSGDVSRAKLHGKVDTERAAYEFMIGLAVGRLKVRGKAGAAQLVADEDGRWRFADGVTFDDLRFDGKKLYRVVKGMVLDEDTVRAIQRMETSSYEVQVIGKSGKPVNKRLRLHPLAAAFPSLKETEFTDLVHSVADVGILQPVLVRGDEVLDGRHRLLAAIGLKKPVPIRVFDGSDEQARAEVWALNVARRHLHWSTTQKGLLAREWFLPKAEEEAADRKAKLSGTQKSRSDVVVNLPQRDDQQKRAPNAAEVAAKRSGTGVSEKTIRDLAVVDDAPKTKERIRNGELATVNAARQAALEEKGQPVAPPEPATTKHPKSVYTRLGNIITHYRYILADTATHDGGTPADKFTARLDEIEELHRQVMAKLRN